MFLVDCGAFIVVDGPDIDERDIVEWGPFVHVFGSYRQKNGRLVNGRFLYTRKFEGAGDRDHPDYDKRRYDNDEEDSDYDDVEILYDGSCWVMRRERGGPPLIWSSPTDAFFPPRSKWITAKGVNRQIVVRHAEPPGKKTLVSLYYIRVYSQQSSSHH